MALSRIEACEYLIDVALDGPRLPMDVHLCNAYTLAIADKDQSFRNMLNESGLNLADGMSVVWANRLLHRGGQAPTGRVYGPDLFLDIFRAGTEYRLRHYLLGSTPEVLTNLSANLRRLFPGVQIVGTESPPYRDLTDIERGDQLDRIVTSRAQLVWVGLGTPKQDVEVAWLAHQRALVFVAVGAAFDFVAGSKRQAPAWMQRMGLEWIFRLLSEPRRLWRRYLFGNLRFLLALVRR
jgi:N-acetylglucosaminyldiphosphoundecaprenol N-acetyl-beta-D-mannosaminyltransferase